MELLQQSWIHIYRKSLRRLKFILEVISYPPSLATSKIMQYLKGRSFRLLQEQFPELKKRYWGQHLWARGYFSAKEIHKHIKFKVHSYYPCG